ncbi:hypothetical protein Bca52824_037099 [Brassica carinata]|uniref:Uncharacterized protein n=1 Tax=Brassica carinata TaxID=52824 RepID=A0A8X7S6N9_BRACI|nr:hypothetical protein Bca52824_037099 [Brassica carinata]
MATTSSTAKNKPDNQNLTRSRSLGPKPKPVPSSNTDGSGRKTVEKPVPNYLKPTVSSRPDPVKFLRKNKAVEDNQKLLRRRSFDRPLSSSSTSSTHKSLNTSPPARPREKPVTGLRSASFHGSSSRGGPRGSTTVKSPPVLASRGPPGVKKSGLSGTSSSKSKKEGFENVPKKSLGKEITPECYPPAPDHEDEKEIVKFETDVQVSDHIEEEEGKDQVAQPDESGELINEEQTEEQKEPENTQEEEEVEKKVDVEEISEAVVTPDMKEAEVKEEERERNKSTTM